MITFYLALLGTVRSSICSDTIEALLNNTHSNLQAKSSYSDALENFMYSGKFLNELGHYEACLRKKNANYFLLQAKQQFKLGIGVCVPDDCSLENVNYFAQKFSGGRLTAGKVYESDVTGFGWFIIVMLIFFTILATLASFYDFSDKSNLLFSLIHSFSFKNNYNFLVNVREAKKGDNSGILDFIRFISLFFVICTHSISFKTQNFVYNIEELGHIYKMWWRFFGYCAEMAVDTFFWVGGFLLGYLLLQEVEKKRGRFGVMGWLLVYLHRFARILPVYSFVLAFYMNIFPAMGSGPNWQSIKLINRQCSEYWWSILTFTNNFVPDGYGNSCLGVGWYLANDMQFFLTGPILIMIYYKTRRVVSWSIHFILMIIGFFVSFGIAYDHEYKVMKTAPKNYEGGLDDYEHLYYTKPYTRFFPYLVGLYSGYIYLRYYTRSVLKVEDTQKDRIIDSITWLMRDKFYGTISFIVASVVTWCMFDMSRIFCDNIFDNDYWSRSANSIWLPLRHIIYSYSLTFVLLPIMMGRFPMICQIMSLKIFSALGKISFTSFLVQFGTLFGVFALDRAPNNCNGSTVLKDTIVALIVTLIVSLPVYLLIEAPFANLERIVCTLLVRPRQRQQKT